MSQLCGTLLQDALGTQFTEIPYAGTAPAMSALPGGQVDMLCDQTTQTLPQIKGGGVKLYGVTTLERIKALPDAPTKQTPEGLHAWLQSETTKWSGMMKKAGIEPQ